MKDGSAFEPVALSVFFLFDSLLINFAMNVLVGTGLISFAQPGNKPAQRFGERYQVRTRNGLFEKAATHEGCEPSQER